MRQGSQSKRKRSNDRSRSQSEAAAHFQHGKRDTNQGAQVAHGSWKGQGKSSRTTRRKAALPTPSFQSSETQIELLTSRTAT